jgi:hypothetical protein
MSPYSSVLRESVWGGVPISLPAMAVFAFLGFWGASLYFLDRQKDQRATGFYALATALPALTSLVMGILSLSQLDAVCKLCIGIYVASLACVIGAVWMWRNARRVGTLPSVNDPQPMSIGALAVAFAIGCMFVGISVVAYAAAAPDFDRYAGACGKLESAKDPQGVLIALGSQTSSVRMLEVLDPLCPACRAFERRFSALEASEGASRQALLFPLDNDCNWMVDSAVHPGACAISEAMLCAEGNAEEVLDWAFAEQEEIVAAERAEKGSARKLAIARFPMLADCVGSSKAKARLNRALRFAVDNHLPVLTPQLYVNGVRLCDADTDLGLDYMLSRLLGGASHATR